MTQELVELKYRVLQQRITDTQETLELMDKLIPCQNDIKSMEIISMEYEKMYQAILQSGEYEKYQEVEKTIIAQISKIEAKLDRKIYQLSSQYPKYFESIEQSENYKNFHGLDIELEKLYALKELLIKCRTFHSQEQQNNLKEKILDLRFRVLVRRQVEQMVYESHSTKSWLSSRKSEEVFYFTPRIREMVKRVKDVKSDILYSYGSRAIMDDSILINHLIFKLLEQEIEENPQKYIGLLLAQIFNPHLCNIANNPFEVNIPYSKLGPDNFRFTFSLDGKNHEDDMYLERSEVNLLLLRAVLDWVIGKENTTIVECGNIFSRFGFECRPIVFCEGQELIRILYSKVKDNLEPKQKDTSKTNGRYCSICIEASTYEFNPKQEPFFTNAELRKLAKNKSEELGALMFYRYYFDEDKGLINQELNLSGMESIINRRSKILENITGVENNDWMRLPLLKTHQPFKNVEFPKHSSSTSSHRAHVWKTRVTEVSDYKPLWKAYKSDFEKLGLHVKMKEFPRWDVKTYIMEEEPFYRRRRAENRWWNSFSACINLDDIADLPIDFEKIYILTEEDMKKVQQIEEREQREEER